MASYIPGYDEQRFASSVNQNFLCLICFNVLRDPVMCPRNHHCFCRGCITKHLVENSQRCPTCADPLSVETLTGAPPIVKDYINELNVYCKYVNRGYQETVQLQHLDRHEATCGFQPVVCTNQGCGVTVSRHDLIHHESELCEYHKLKCHSCGEMETKVDNLEKNMADIKTDIERNTAEIKADMERNTTDMEGKLEAVNNEVRGLKTALIEGFDQMKEVLVKMENMTEEISRKVRPGASGDKEKENIFVAGGMRSGSVEMFNWRQKLWSPLKSMPEERWGATSFVYNNQVTVAGGENNNMIRMNIDPHPDLSKHWSEFPVKLPARLTYHSSVLYNDQLLVTGGDNGNLWRPSTSDRIDIVQLVPPYAVKTLSRMPEPRRQHSTQIFDENLLIVGGTTTVAYRDNLKSVLLYDIKKNGCKRLSPLPYEVSEMASVRWGDNIVVIGGRDKHANVLDTVIIYNVKTEQSHMLPPMRCKRWRCAAVVVGNNIVVLGGCGGQGWLKSVEAFNFDSYTWEELPEMSEERWLHTAVVV